MGDGSSAVPSWTSAGLSCLACFDAKYIMRISEILEGIDPTLLERVPNGSRFRYGPPTVNQFDDCVDLTDPTCPGHRVGLAWGLSHPNEPAKPTTPPSVKNGIQQAQNAVRAGVRPIGPTMHRGGRFIGTKSQNKPKPQQNNQTRDR